MGQAAAGRPRLRWKNCPVAALVVTGADREDRDDTIVLDDPSA